MYRKNYRTFGHLNVTDFNIIFVTFIAYLSQVLVRQQMQLSGFETVLTFAFVEEVRLKFPTGVFFCGRHYISFPFKHWMTFLSVGEL